MDEQSELLLHFKQIGLTTDRKLRFFVAACWRRVWSNIATDEGRACVELVEAYADGQARMSDLARAYNRQQEGYGDEACSVAAPDAFYAANLAADGTADLMADIVDVSAYDEQRAAQMQMLHDIFGTATVEPAWRTAEVLAAANAAYRERQLPDGALNPSRLAELSAALQAAGCDDEQVLTHLKGSGPHVRGCWLIDLLLNKR